jgi:hypothetical protein
MENTEKFALVGGALATVALVILALREQNGGGSVQPTLNTIVRSVSPETVQLRGLKAQTDLAEISARTQMFGFVADYYKSIVGADLSKFQSTNDLEGRKFEAQKALENTQAQANVIEATARIQSETQQKEAFYNLEAVKLQEKTKGKAQTKSLIGNIIGGFLKFI